MGNPGWKLTDLWNDLQFVQRICDSASFKHANDQDIEKILSTCLRIQVEHDLNEKFFFKAMMKEFRNARHRPSIAPKIEIVYEAVIKEAENHKKLTNPPTAQSVALGIIAKYYLEGFFQSGLLERS